MTNDLEIPIINAPAPVGAAISIETLPHEGETGSEGQEHFAWTPFRKKSVKDLADQMTSMRDKIGAIIKGLEKSVVDNATLDEITIGLAVSIEGHIGLASAGAEASIELKYKIKP